MNQIQTLIASHVQGDEQKREEVIRNLGFEHLAEARKLFGNLERTGEVHSKLIRKNLYRALGLQAYIVHDAFMCDKDEQDEAREIAEVRAQHGRWKNFKPLIQVLTESEIPSPIFVAAMTGSYRKKTIHLDQALLKLPEAEQFAAVSKIVKAHYEENRCGNKNIGGIIAFGAITQYEYRQTYFRTVGFDLTGQFMGSRWWKQPPPVGKAVMGLGKKEATSELQSMLIASPMVQANAEQ